MQKKYVFILILVALLAGTIVAVNPAFNNNEQELKSQVADNELVTEGDTTAEAFKWYQMKEALALQENRKKCSSMFTLLGAGHARCLRRILSPIP